MSFVVIILLSSEKYEIWGYVNSVCIMISIISLCMYYVMFVLLIHSFSIILFPCYNVLVYLASLLSPSNPKARHMRSLLFSFFLSSPCGRMLLSIQKIVTLTMLKYCNLFVCIWISREFVSNVWQMFSFYWGSNEF